MYIARGKAHVGHEVVFICIHFNTHHVSEADVFCMPHLQCIHFIVAKRAKTTYNSAHLAHIHIPIYTRFADGL